MNNMQLCNRIRSEENEREIDIGVVVLWAIG